MKCHLNNRRRLPLLKSKNDRNAIRKRLALGILRTVRSYEGFWFYNAPGDFSGKTATSLYDLSKMLKEVTLQSIDYHFSREDFRRWIQFIIGDISLAINIKRIPKDKRGESLRSDLIKVVDERISELKTFTKNLK